MDSLTTLWLASIVVDEASTKAIKKITKPRTVKAVVYSEKEKALLAKVFETNHFPSKTEIRAIAEHLHRTPRQINIHFQNRRQRIRSPRIRIDSELL